MQVERSHDKISRTVPIICSLLISTALLAVSVAAEETESETLLIAGILDQGDTIERLTLQLLVMDGEPPDDSPLPGEYSLQLLDMDGQPIMEVPFGISFWMETHPPKETDQASIAFHVLYPAKATTLQILRGSRVLLRVNITAELLHDAVEGIADRGFQDPVNGRAELLQMISTLETLLERGAIDEAAKWLQEDVKGAVTRLLVDYKKQYVLEVSKSDVLELADRLAKRLR